MIHHQLLVMLLMKCVQTDNMFHAQFSFLLHHLKSQSQTLAVQTGRHQHSPITTFMLGWRGYSDV